MVPADNHTSRYRTAVNRSIARRRAALAALALVPGLACSAYDDAEVFRTATTVPPENAETTIASTPATEPAPEVAPDTAIAPETTAVPATEAVADTTTTAPIIATTTTPTSTAPDTASTVAAFAAGAELAVSFTFSPTEGGRRIENPYIAVWVEDPSGNLVRTISLWYEQSQEGPKWLSHLSRWTSATNEAVDTTTSGATRVPGDYTVVWDGTTDDGSLATDGEFVLFVEAARRGGAYDITTTPIGISNSGFSIELPDSGELTAVSATLLT